ncbi:sensor histidine kinase [Nakamurella deserti]|uniref:sensor histidine kinase n=1 Tax=Nakamurella deserti TaxID=2164074 RepID=UPI000DBE6969|nr:ATP-binding protein [Nakamurella deserti]
MRDAGLRRASGGRSLRLAVGLTVVATVVLAGVETVLLVAVGGPTAVLLMFPATGLVYTGVGALAWVRRPANRTGPLFVVGGLVWLGAGLLNTAPPPLVAVGQIMATVPLAIVLHALLAFPSGRVGSGLPATLVVAGYLTTVVGQAPLYLFGGPDGGAGGPLVVADRPELVAVGQQVQAGIAAVLIAVTSVLLVRRLVRGDLAHRRVLGPLYGFGVFAVVGVTASVNVLARFVELDPLVVPVVQIAVLAGVPVAFVAAVLRGGFSRTAGLEELGVWLGSHRAARDDLGATLARALGDPGATLLYRVESGDGRPDWWADGDGTPVTVDDDGRHRTVPVVLDGERIAAIRYDAALIRDPAEVRAVGRVAAIAIGHERLTTQLLATREQLLTSRRRLVEAGDQERRRLARDLHDRLQNRLVLLGLQVGGRLAAPAHHDDPVLLELRRGLDEAITELRLLVQGVLPAVLIERGLYAALESMADRCPIPTTVEIGGATDGRLPTAVETTAYHVVSEALTNAVKHSAAGAVDVRVRRTADRLHILVADDGVGGAVANGGVGLAGMADRVAALRGTLTVDSAPGTGTRLTVEMPCGW